MLDARRHEHELGRQLIIMSQNVFKGRPGVASDVFGDLIARDRNVRIVFAASILAHHVHRACSKSTRFQQLVDELYLGTLVEGHDHLVIGWPLCILRVREERSDWQLVEAFDLVPGDKDRARSVELVAHALVEDP